MPGDLTCHDFSPPPPPKKFTPKLVGIPLQLHFLKPKCFSRRFSAYRGDQDVFCNIPAQPAERVAICNLRFENATICDCNILGRSNSLPETLTDFMRNSLAGCECPKSWPYTRNAQGMIYQGRPSCFSYLRPETAVKPRGNEKIRYFV